MAGREPPKPSDHDWAAMNSPFAVQEAESHPGTWIIRNKDGVPLMHGSSKEAAEMMKSIWEEEATAYWMLAP